MQVTCPQCGARYAVDPSAIGPTGRTVQCARCSHRWFEKVEAAPAASSIPPPRNERPVPDFVIRPQPHYSAGLPAISPPRRTVHWSRWIGAAAVLLVVVGVAAFAWRGEIRDRLPASWSAFLSLDGARGLLPSPAKAMRSTPPEEARIELDLAASKIEFVDGGYVVRGELFNGGRAAGSTSMLKLIFRKGDDVLGERAYPMAEGPIAPGGRLSFSRPFDDPPDGTTNIVPSVE
jgi:predicted Zn finger-like uncharacterized protein